MFVSEGGENLFVPILYMAISFKDGFAQRKPMTINFG